MSAGIAADKERATLLEANGHCVLLRANNDVLSNIDSAFADILSTLTRTPTPNPSPQGGGEARRGASAPAAYAVAQRGRRCFARNRMLHYLWSQEMTMPLVGAVAAPHSHLQLFTRPAESEQYKSDVQKGRNAMIALREQV